MIITQNTMYFAFSLSVRYTVTRDCCISSQRFFCLYCFFIVLLLFLLTFLLHSFSSSLAQRFANLCLVASSEREIRRACCLSMHK